MAIAHQSTDGKLTTSLRSRKVAVMRCRIYVPCSGRTTWQSLMEDLAVLLLQKEIITNVSNNCAIPSVAAHGMENYSSCSAGTLQLVFCVLLSFSLHICLTSLRLHSRLYPRKGRVPRASSFLNYLLVLSRLQLCHSSPLFVPFVTILPRLILLASKMVIPFIKCQGSHFWIPQ